MRRLITPCIRIYDMAKTIRVSDELHALIKARNREGETMDETLKRLVGGPHPEEVAGFLSGETAEAIRAHIEAKRERDAESRRRIVERIEDS